MAPRRVRVNMIGRVQGVAFRASTATEARDRGLVGWVRNLADGSVELEAEGAPVHVAALVAWCAHGPPAARVDRVITTEIAPTGLDREFAVRPSEPR